MNERRRFGITVGDGELIGGETNPYLRDCLERVNDQINNYKGRIVSGALPNLLFGHLPIVSSFILRIHDSARKAGVIEPINGNSKKGYYYYDREDVLAISAVCWLINEEFRENGSFEESWVDIVSKTKDLLGGDNFISRKLKLPNDSNAHFSAGLTSYESFINGRRKRGSKYANEDRRDRQKPRVYTPREIIEDVQSWDVEKIKGLLDGIPDTADSIDSVPALRVVSSYIIDNFMVIDDISHRQDPDFRRINEDSVSALRLKRAIRNYLSLHEFFKRNGEDYDMLGMLGAVRRMQSA